MNNALVAAGGGLNCIGDYWQYWPWQYTYPTTTITIATTIALYAKCEHCAKTEQSTGFLPAGWAALEVNGLKHSMCSMMCVAAYVKANSK